MSQCYHNKYPAAITAFGTQSTGLKVKGDGNQFPPDNYNPSYTWGECPTCKYVESARRSTYSCLPGSSVCWRGCVCKRTPLKTCTNNV